MSPRKILPYSRSPHVNVRACVAGILPYFRAPEVEPALMRLVADPSKLVQARALASLVCVLGLPGAAKRVEGADADTVAMFVERAAEAADAEQAAKVLARFSARPEGDVREAVRRAARALLAEPELGDELRGRLDALAAEGASPDANPR